VSITLSFDKELIGPWVFKRVAGIWSPEGREVVGLVRDGKVLGGVVFEDYTGPCIRAHIALSSPRVPSRKLFTTAVGYAYNQLGVQKMLAMIASNNLASLKMCLRLGFKAEAIIKGVFEDSDLVIMSMTREDCAFIPKPMAA
jgi:L-amino acid N-acyltransferase YncA